MPRSNEESERAPRPTDAELAILRVLWDRGASTVREVHEALEGEKEVGYTTTLKLLQKMAAKDLVSRDECSGLRASTSRHVPEPFETLQQRLNRQDRISVPAQNIHRVSPWKPP